MEEGLYRDRGEWDHLQRVIKQFFDRMEMPAGLFVQNGSFARLIIQEALARGLHVPHDLAVICQFNVNLIVDTPPQITSIEANYERVGFEAARLLNRILDGQPVPTAPVFVTPLGVIGRETTDYFAVKDEVVAEALRYISSRLQQPLRVDQIAYELSISPRLLQQRVAKALGRGISDEIRRLRLEKAKRLLTDPARLIGSIPKEVGFESANVMCRAFQQALGMPPRDYRKTLLGESQSD